MKPFVRTAGAFAIAFLCTGLASAEVKLPAIFSDHMVLQRDMEIPVWGWAGAGEKVTVTLGDTSTEATADASGKWTAKLAKHAAGGPFEFKAKSASGEAAVKDVYVGEVWLCSGQSNMGMTVSRAKDFAQEQAAAKLPLIRQYAVERGPSKEAEADRRGSWEVCGPDTVGNFTATGYFFCREIHKTLNVPVGIINSSVGGTPIESWIRKDAQLADPHGKEFVDARVAEASGVDLAAAKAKYDEDLAQWKEASKKARAEGKKAPRAPQDPVALAERKGDVGGLYNGMIAPIIKYGFRGAIWYQGEANSVPEKASYYQYHLAMLVKDWREQHGAGNFPFGWMQLPNFGGPGRNWPLVREGMFKTLALPHTGMAVTMDIGEAGNIHPVNKQEAGRRLAQWALADVYQQKVAGGGPRFAGLEIQGNKAVVKFTQADGMQLTAKPESELVLAVAGTDRQWKPAQASVEGDKLVVSSPDVAAPVAVRYLWSNNPPSAPLAGKSGLLASPFRTDDWSENQPFDTSEAPAARRAAKK